MRLGILLLLSALVAPCAAQDLGTEFGPLDDVNPFPQAVHPSLAGITYDTAPTSVAPIRIVAFPFVDEQGRNWILRVDLQTKLYDLRSSNGTFGSSASLVVGPLTDDQVYIFRKVAEDKRYKDKDPNNRYLQPAWIWEATRIGIGIVVDWLAGQYEDATTPDPNIDLEHQMGLMCSSMVVAQTTQAWAAGEQECPREQPVVREDGRICVQVPAMTEAMPDMCRGQMFSGYCRVDCQ